MEYLSQDMYETELTKREATILEEVKGNEEKAKAINLEISDELYKQAKMVAVIKDISIENVILISVVEDIMTKRKDKALEENPDFVVCDIFDMPDIENIIDYITKEETKALVLTLDEAKSFIILPVEEYDKLKKKEN